MKTWTLPALCTLIPRALVVLVVLAAIPHRCPASVTLGVDAVTVLHDGRSVLIEASATDPGNYGAVDWVPGWIDSRVAVLTVTRSGSSSTKQLIFAGAVLRVEDAGIGGTLRWTIYGLLPSATDVIIHTDTVHLSSDAGWLQDSAGNSLASTSSVPVTNYSIVGTDGFIDENQFAFDNTIYVDLSSNGNDWTCTGCESAAWTRAGSQLTPLNTLSRALYLYNNPTLSGAGTSCRIRIKRGTVGAESTGVSFVDRGGASLTSPLLITTYDTGARPEITYPDDFAGLMRQHDSPHANFVYINGIYFHHTGTPTPNNGIENEGDDNHFVVSDRKVEGFSDNIAFDNSYFLPDPDNSQWWSFFRNIIVDARATNTMPPSNSQGIFAGTCTRGLLISQNFIDHNGWNYDYTVRGGLRHNIYIGADHSGPFVWGNMVTRGSAFGCKMDCGGVIYGNVFADDALSCDISGDPADVEDPEGEAGGRIARNYFEHGQDINSTDHRGWGPHLAGSHQDIGRFGPSIIELNCMANTDGTAPYSAGLEESSSAIFSNPEVIVRNNTAIAYGPFGIDTNSTYGTSPPIVVATRNAWDSTGSATDQVMALSDWPITSGLTLKLDENLYKSTSSSCIDRGGTSRTLTQWRSDASGQDIHSVNSTPTYASTGHDLGSYGHHLGLISSYDRLDYYAVLRDRGIGDNTASLIDFLSAAAYMIGKYEVTSPTISSDDPDPLLFYGSGDGSDPQVIP